MCRVEVAKALRYTRANALRAFTIDTKYPKGLWWGRTRQTTLCCGNTQRAKPVGGESARVRLCREVLQSELSWSGMFFLFCSCVMGSRGRSCVWEELGGRGRRRIRKKQSKSCFAGRRDGRKPGDWDFPHGSDHGRSCASWESCISSPGSESDRRSNQAYSASQVHFSAPHYGLACFHQGSYSHEVFARSSQAEAEGGHLNTKPFKWPSPIEHHVLELSLFFGEVFFTSTEGFAELHSWKNGFGVFSLDSIHVKNTDLEEALVVLQTLNAPSGGYALIVRQIWHKRKV